MAVILGPGDLEIDPPKFDICGENDAEILANSRDVCAGCLLPSPNEAD